MGFLNRLRRDEVEDASPLEFTFEWDERSTEADDGEELAGRGYALRDKKGNAIAWDDESLARDGVSILRVAGVSHRRDALQDDACRPGMSVELRPDKRNQHDPNAVQIWSAAGQIGSVPIEHSSEVAARLQREAVDARILWEWRTPGGERSALRVVVAPRGLLPPFPE